MFRLAVGTVVGVDISSLVLLYPHTTGGGEMSYHEHCLYFMNGKLFLARLVSCPILSERLHNTLIQNRHKKSKTGFGSWGVH